MATLRLLITLGGEISEIGYSLPDDVEGAVDRAESAVYALRPEGGDPLQGDIAAQVDQEWLAAVEEREAAGGLIECPTGFADLDAITGGLEPDTLTLFAARPGMGKTDVACTIAAHVANREPVLMFSIEMARRQILNRLICARAGLDRHEIAHGRVLYGAWEHLHRASAHVSSLALDVRDSPSVTLMGVRAAARRVKSRRGLGLVIVDHLGLMVPPAGLQNRENEVAALAWGLKVLSKDLHVPVVAMVQLNRSLETRADKRPTLPDLRDSGRLEEAADNVIGIYRGQYYYPDNEALRGIAELLGLKVREGQAGRTVRVRADMVTGRWGDLSRREAV